MNLKELSENIKKLKEEISEIKEQSSLNLSKEELKTVEKQKIIHELKVHQVELEMQNQMLQESQQQLIKTYEHYQKLFDLSPGGLVLVDKAGIIRKVNSGFLRMLDDGKNIVNKPFADIIQPKDQPVFNGRFRVFFKAPENKEMLIRLISEKRGFIYTRITGAEFKQLDDTKETLLLLSIADITELKENEKELSESKRFLEHILNTVSNGLFTVDADCNVTSWNKAAENITGYARDEIIGNKCSIFNPCDESCIFRKIEETGLNEIQTEEMFVTKSGEQITIFKKAVLLRDEDNNVIGGLESFDDITQEKIAQEELQRKTRFIEAVADATPALLYIYDLEAEKNIWSNNMHKNYFYDIFKGECAAEDIDFNRIKSVIHEDDFINLQQGVKSLVSGRNGNHIKSELRINNNGTWDYMSHYMSSFEKDENDNVVKIIAALVDINDAKRNEHRIEKLLEEKKIVLKEVHHRIKNNMLTIEVLLAQHAEHLNNKEAVQAISNAVGRVASMRVLYEKLFNEDTFNISNIGDYLSTLINEILNVFSNDNVEIVKDIDKFEIDTRYIFPIGLIINELITNSMKYAFTKDKKGHLLISLKKAGKHITICVKDDGKGFPDESSIDKGSHFGLELIRLMVQQINAVMRIENKPGTEVNISFNHE